MENFGLLFGGMGLLLCLGGLGIRFYVYNPKIEHPSPIFTGYVVGSVFLGVAIVALGFVDFSSPWDIIIFLLLVCWNGVSVLATFSAPARWAAFPVGYICLCASYLLWSFGDDTPDPSRPFVSTILFGAVLALWAIVTLALVLKKRLGRSAH